MVLSHSESLTSWPKGSCEKLVRNFFHQYWIAFKMMKYFMQASYNITGQMNGANVIQIFARKYQRYHGFREARSKNYAEERGKCKSYSS